MNPLAFSHPTQSSALGEAVYLSFQLYERMMAAFPMAQVDEVVTVSSPQITPVPNMSPSVLGLLTQRSRVIWAVDLAHMLLQASPHPTGISHTVIVIRIVPKLQQSLLPTTAQAQSLLGLIVPAVKGAVRFSPELIQTPQMQFSPALMSCLQGCLLQQKDMLLVLDAAAIAHSPILHGH